MSITTAYGRFSTAWPTLNTVGAKLLVAITPYCSPSETIVDSLGNTWTAGTFSNSGGGPGGQSKIHWCLNPSTTSTTHQISMSDGNVSGATVTFIAVFAATAFTLNNQGVLTDGTFAATSIQPFGGAFTPSANGAVMFTGGTLTNGTGTGQSVNAGFALITNATADAPYQIAAYLEQATAAAVNPTLAWTGGASRYAASWVAFVPAAGPVITGHPSNATVVEPGTQAFQCAYTGTLAGHQWQVSTDGGTTYNNVTDGTGQSGGAGSGATLTYTTTAVAVSTGNHRNSYRYRCVLNPGGTPVTSNAATLTVDPAATTAGSNTGIGATAATINWTNNAAGNPTTRVQFETPSGAANWTNASGGSNPTAANATSFAASGLTAGTQYRFRTGSTVGGRDAAWTVHAAFTTAASDTTPPSLTSASATGGTLTGTGNVTSDETGTLFWLVNQSATPLTIPAYPAAMTGWTSRSLAAAANSWGLGALAAGSGNYLHLCAEDPSGNRRTTDLVVGPFTVAALAGFDFHTHARCKFTSFSGALVGIGNVIGAEVRAHVYTQTEPPALIASSSPQTINSSYRIPRFEHAAIALGTAYSVLMSPTDKAAFKPFVITLVAT